MYQDFYNCNLDIETGIETLKLQSLYYKWYQKFQNFNLDIKTGIEIFRIGVLI